MAVVPRAPIEIAPATPTMYGTTATIEARQWREFKRYDPVVFYGGTDMIAAELFLKITDQEQQLEEILVILRASVAVASVPSTVRATVTQEENTPGVTTMTLLPTTTATRPVMAIVPRAPIEIAPATPTVSLAGDPSLSLSLSHYAQRNCCTWVALPSDSCDMEDVRDLTTLIVVSRTPRSGRTSGGSGVLLSILVC
ncbi:hypothetical protein Sjap_023873 [Stephania japonica]|uniref:Uncharacterized protein n=1 Tax=Stephania japonica TaxID=461633 RepID=A0AAP0ECE6_9MAGN